MKNFTELYQALDETTSTNRKIEAMVQYFRSAPQNDIPYAIYFLLGNKLSPTVAARTLREAARTASAIPEWLFEECYEWVGDLAETMASIIPVDGESEVASLDEWVQHILKPIVNAKPEQQGDLLKDAWLKTTSAHRFVMNKLLTGNLRVGVSQKLLTRAISEWTGLSSETISHRLMGEWVPTAESMDRLLNQDARDSDVSRPYPFCLAQPITKEIGSIGNRSEFIAEWKWDGIRAQLVRRQNTTYLWSRGEDLLQGRFPEIEAASQSLPDGTVLDGEILAWSGDRPLPFALLQKRIQRKRVGPKLLQEVPVRFLAFDVLEYRSEDIRSRLFHERRRLLESLEMGSACIGISPSLSAESWQQLAEDRACARERGAEGLMLKRLDSPYGVGRTAGLWWKWKMDPYSLDAVMMYAQRGHGRRATLFTDYTFGVWDEGVLVPFAKAYSGLNEEEIGFVDRWIRANTLEKFGPVHAVRPEIVMEIAFENVQHSPRHKSGIAVRFPRIVRIRTDKTADQADSIASLRAWVSFGSKQRSQEQTKTPDTFVSP
ncbi:MAG: ATP-dependent DNA ligase [Pirellula sp.]|nr:ATP-dependent DNA ligase [Pirellula sp.]